MALHCDAVGSHAACGPVALTDESPSRRWTSRGLKSGTCSQNCPLILDLQIIDILFASCPPARRTTFDVLSGMVKAMHLDFLNYETFNTEMYEYLYSPANYDLSCISPKFVAFSSPNSFPCEEMPYQKTPETFFEPFKYLGVSDVVRLNRDDYYNKQVFEDEGYKFHDLPFPDCTCPNPEIIKQFLDIVDKAKGVVAVHCLAGLGRTGTLIACHMIKNYGFSAREAIGYLRLMRPGSVIAKQQHFLETIQDAQWRGNFAVISGDGQGRPGPRLQASLGKTSAGDYMTRGHCDNGPAEQSRKENQVEPDCQGIQRSAGSPKDGWGVSEGHSTDDSRDSQFRVNYAVDRDHGRGDMHERRYETAEGTALQVRQAVVRRQAKALA